MELLRNIQQGSQSQKQSIGLEQILSSEALCEAIRRHSSLVGRDELFSNLPEGDNDRSLQTLLSHVRSPQFRQTLDVFSTAMATGQLTGLMRDFGLDPSVADPHRGGG